MTTGNRPASGAPLRRVCGRNTVTEVLVNLVEPPVVGWDPGYGKKTPGGAGGVGTHTGRHGNLPVQL